MQASDLDQRFVALLTRHHGQLFGFIYALVHNVHDAEELFQKTSIVLWRKFPEFVAGSDFVAWACQTARFEILNFIKARRRDRHFFGDAFLSQVVADQCDRAQELDARREALGGCLQKLSPKDRRLLERCYGGDENFKEVAEDIGRPVGSVYDSLSRIRRALYECIERSLRAAPSTGALGAS